MEWNPQFDILLNLLVAALLGGIVGFEREWASKPAGLRTNILIAVSSALFISLGRIIITDYYGLVPTDSFGMDATRVLHAIIVGVGFLGAGTILKSPGGEEVRFLTTSATIWASAAVGICVGLHQYWLAAGATLLILIVNLGLNYFWKKVEEKRADSN